ncbi:MAG: DUF6600 domain-containing protein [Acidobacteriaceae bacterium]
MIGAALLLSIGLPLRAQSDFGSASTDPPSRVARISYLTGTVSFEPAGESAWSDASLNYPLTTEDRLYTGQNARAELETGNLAVRMAENTDLTATDVSDQLVQLGLAQGAIEVRPFEMMSGSAVEVDTPNVAVTMNQGGNYRIETYPDQQTTVVSVRSGFAEISGNGGGGVNQTVRSGESVRLSGPVGQVRAETLALPGTDNFDSWGASRDRNYLANDSSRYVSRYTPGYYDLNSYGDWNSAPDYGDVWYPRGVAADWVPYRDGRWVWVSPWGWTWVEQEPWGFAPFHYGRWALISNRWGWLPGPVLAEERPVYAPALVAFVGGNGFGNGFGDGGGGLQAWFPLGPGEIYRPWYHHSENYIRQVNVTNVRNINVTNITNITNVTNERYVNRAAVTAVPTQAFRSAQPVAAHAVKISQAQIAQAKVIPHAEVAPVARAVAGGEPATHPPARVARPAVVQRPPVRQAEPPAKIANRPGEASAQAQRAVNPPPARVNTPPERANTPPARANTPPERVNTPPDRANVSPERPAPVRTEAPPPNAEPATRNKNAPPPPTATASQERPNAPRPNQPPPPQPSRNTERPQFVTRTPPPAPKPSFQARQPALEQHPGRPLEPQQEQNLRQGRPAGPMQDTERVPHSPAFQPAPPPPPASRPEARPAPPPQREAPRPEPKQGPPPKEQPPH